MIALTSGGSKTNFADDWTTQRFDANNYFTTSFFGAILVGKAFYSSKINISQEDIGFIFCTAKSISFLTPQASSFLQPL